MASAGRKRRSGGAAFLAVVLLVFGILIPSLHHASGQVVRQSSGRPTPSATISRTANATAAHPSSDHQVSRPQNERALTDCALCDWLFSAAYLAAVVPALLFSLTVCSPRAPSPPFGSLCSRPAPR
ncbi:MAG: hypothetical protein H7Z41_17705, partial [Cytophagales bacterium]|nr:hypothetical protein [Armatimonadota bacterium]